ncbi:MAG: tRNA (adenosine(37)-N6)-dimethylallyltransferase MiaA [Clostridia bacterium]|nr:tRNA (adenosine(37)-N6)-dimethylallyltransferase MiaA [Clostridia bacterium]
MKAQAFGIVGPTACGKTAVSIAVALRTGAEIISADSVQVYRGLDIGSAKPGPAERRGVPHHMIDCVDIDEPGFSVAAFRDAALQAARDILSRGKTPIIVGGSGLYVDALTRPLRFAVPADPAIRRRYEEAYERDREAVFAELIRTDPATAKRLHPNDKKRVARALEVQACGGRPLSDYGGGFQEPGGQEAPPLGPVRLFGLHMPREALYARIGQRVDQMLAAGLESEARAIWERGYDPALPAMQSIGYKQLFACFAGACGRAEAVERIKMDTRRFAKRQETWFKRNKNIIWMDAEEPEEAVRRILEEMRA